MEFTKDARTYARARRTRAENNAEHTRREFTRHAHAALKRVVAFADSSTPNPSPDVARLYALGYSITGMLPTRRRAALLGAPDGDKGVKPKWFKNVVALLLSGDSLPTLKRAFGHIQIHGLAQG